jgi:CRISPR-associated Cas5-like protein
MSERSTRVFDSVIARGELLKYAAGDVIADPRGGAGQGKANRDGIWLVLAGLVKSSFRTPDGQTQVCPSLRLPTYTGCTGMVGSVCITKQFRSFLRQLSSVSVLGCIDGSADPATSPSLWLV